VQCALPTDPSPEKLGQVFSAGNEATVSWPLLVAPLLRLPCRLGSHPCSGAQLGAGVPPAALSPEGVHPCEEPGSHRRTEPQSGVHPWGQLRAVSGEAAPLLCARARGCLLGSGSLQKGWEGGRKRLLKVSLLLLPLRPCLAGGGGARPARSLKTRRRWQQGNRPAASG